MTEQELVVALGKHAFFEGLSDEDLSKLAGAAAEIEFESGTVIFKEGGPADAAFAIISGSVALELGVGGRELIIQTLHDGEMLGWGWLYPPFRWSFSAVAMHPVRMLRFDATSLRAVLDDNCALGYEVMKRFSGVMTSRLAATRLQLVDFYGNAN